MSALLQNTVGQVLAKSVPKPEDDNNMKERKGKVANATLIREQNNILIMLISLQKS